MPQARAQLWLSAIAMLLFGCSDSQAPTESNFRKAVEAALAAPICRTLTFSGSPPKQMYWGTVSEDSLLLQKAGVINITDAPASPYPNGHVETVHDASLWTEGKGFCLGTRKLEKIVKWTEPSQARNGQIISDVTYEWSLVPAPWATDEVLNGFKEPRRATAQVYVVKTNQGWSALL